jgi:hypothetical protein
MRRIAARAPLATALVFLVGCGYVGGPLTPLANVPTGVSDLAAVERGSAIVVRFTVPTKTTENVDIAKPLKLDLRVGIAPAPFSTEEWADRATKLSGIRVSQGIATCEIPVAPWIGKVATIGVRVFGSNGKAQGWSNFGNVAIIAPPAVPADVAPRNVIAGVLLSWSGAGDRFRVMRRASATEAWTEVTIQTSREWTDTSTEYGKEYTYEVQALVDVGDGKFAESDFSAPRSITPQDEFPPAVPAGLRAVPAVNSIELVWDRNTEPDLALYRVYRSTGDGPSEKLADVDVPSYSDHAVEPGKTYRYAITAVDKTGNESARSGTVEATLTP